ncbi:RDD family protein [Breznakiella homolactica]|uniref:RDD family protein n=1 Tax=Breznakiella homolactica TaxID=2798577 RepID=A0A7T7XQE6_9SPIR|nr:RDD family protein [Breznakiella homolactica]QQO10483.1 RDD family protein [Breznakiella homolactica]
MEHLRDTSRRVETPEGIEFTLYPAGLMIRLCAYAIDELVQYAILLSVYLTAGTLAEITGTWLLMIMIFLVSWFYHVFCELTFKGQSLGKKIMGLRVVRSDGSPVNPGSSFLRNLLRFADTFMFLYYIALFSISLSPGFRRLGDWAADTLVVYTSNSLAPTRRSNMAWLSRFEIIRPSRNLSYEEKQTILMFARRYPLLGQDRAEELARIYAPVLRSGGTAWESKSDAEYLLGIARGLSGDRP